LDSEYEFSSFNLNPAFIPNQAQLRSARDLVECLDLMKASSDGGELLKPSATFNPVLQRFYQVLEKYAGHDPELIAYLLLSVCE
jgi:hypothetical protein